MPDQADASARAVKSIFIGILCIVAGVALVLSPFVWGARFTYNKYFVFVGLVLALLGASIFLNGGIDWLRAKRRG